MHIWGLEVLSRNPDNSHAKVRYDIEAIKARLMHKIPVLVLFKFSI